MEKINIGAELNPIFGRIGSAKHIYDYSNELSQERINTLLLNEMFSFNMGLTIDTTGIGNTIISQGNNTIIEYTGNKLNPNVCWNITRKHFEQFVLDKTVSEDGIYFKIDNPNSILSELTEEQKWMKNSRLRLEVDKGITTITMGLSLTENYNVEQEIKLYVVPPIYYGFSIKEDITNPATEFTNKLLSIGASGKYQLKNGEEDAYFYICVPQSLGIKEIEISSSGFRVPFIKVDSGNISDSGLDRYDCWRNEGYKVLKESEIVYVVK